MWWSCWVDNKASLVVGGNVTRVLSGPPFPNLSKINILLPLPTQHLSYFFSFIAVTKKDHTQGNVFNWLMVSDGESPCWQNVGTVEWLIF